MGKADVFTGMSLTEKLIWLKKFGNGGGSTPTYEDRTATGNPVIFTTNFAQNAKALSVDFAPKQSLNGFDHPWPGGSGKNLVGESLLTYGKTINASGAIADYSANRCTTLNPILIDNSKSYVISSASTDIRTIYAVYNGSTFVRRVAGATSGTVLNISGGDRVYLCFYVQDTTRPSGQQYDYRKVSPTADEIQFEQGSTPTAYEQYDNVCPIVGVNKITALRTESNALGDLPTTVITSNGARFVTQGQTIVATKVGESSSSAVRYINVPSTLEPGNYYFFGKTKYDSETNVFVWDDTANIRAKKWDGTTQSDLDTGADFGSLHEVKIEEGHSYVIACRLYTYYASVGDSFTFVPTLLKADSNVSKAQINFDGTQYSGSLNVKTGVLTIDKIKIPVSDASMMPEGSNGWKTGTNANRIGFAIDTALLPRQNDSLDILCNIGYASANANINNAFEVGACSLYKGNACMYFRYCVPTSITTVEDAYTFLKNNNCEFTVPLDTPLTYQLTAKELALLEGVNTITTDGDSLNITYQVKV